jgi:hypothetical protein
MRFAVALAVSCGVVGSIGLAPASAAVDCNLAGTTLTVTMTADGDTARIQQSGSAILVREGNAAAIACTGGAPTVTNTDQIVTNDTSGQNTTLAIETAFGAFAPGATDEPGLSDEIELQANMGAGSDTLILIGSTGSDFWRLGDTAAGDGVNLNAGSEASGVVPGRDVDLEYFDVDGRLLINGSVSSDTVLANGGPEFTGPLTTPIDYAEKNLSSGGNDTVAGTAGDDIIEPGFGDDDVSGGAGDDEYREDSDEDDDEVDGGAGVDLYSDFSSTTKPLRIDLRLAGRQNTGALGNDALSRIENVFAGAGDDVLIGSDAGNVLAAGTGDDLVQGLGGTLDTLFGGAGVDMLSYAAAPAAVTVALGAEDPQDTGGAGSDDLDSFESLTGSRFADTLFGSELANRFEVRDGASDNVTCRVGTDTVIADVDGVDTLAADCENRELDLRPDTEITSGPPSLSGDATPSFSFTSSKAGSNFECSLDGGAFGACRSPATLGAVSDGAHRFAARARDTLGALDLSPATRTFTVATAFGSKTLVRLALVAKRVPARGPLPVRVSNKNAFAVKGRLSGRVSRRLKLASKRFRVEAGARRRVKLKLPKAARRQLNRTGRLSVRLTARVDDAAGNRRTVVKTIKPRLKRKRT